MITSNIPIPMSLGIQLQATKGRNQVQAALGSYSALYLTSDSNITSGYLEIPAGKSWESNPKEVVNTILVTSRGPLKFEATNSTGSIVSTINKMLLWDSKLTSFKLTNEGTESVRLDYHMIVEAAPDPVTP